nr:hypothetical protein [Tanacetum cinerariifolium]
MNMLNHNYKTSFTKPEFLKKAQRANPRLYDIGCYNDNLALMLAPESDEMIRLAKESRSKLSDLIRPFDYDQLNNLYDLFVPQREKSPEQHNFSKESKMSHTSAKNESSKDSFNKQTTLLEKRNPRLYDIGCYNDNLALMLAPESDELIRLAKESQSKLSDLIRPFDYDQLNNLYDLFVPQREKSPEQHNFSKESKMSHTSAKNESSKDSFNKQTTLLEKRMDESIMWDQKCNSSKELFKIKKSVDTIFDGVEHCPLSIFKPGGSLVSPTVILERRFLSTTLAGSLAEGTVVAGSTEDVLLFS